MSITLAQVNDDNFSKRLTSKDDSIPEQITSSDIILTSSNIFFKVYNNSQNPNYSRFSFIKRSASEQIRHSDGNFFFTAIQLSKLFAWKRGWLTKNEKRKIDEKLYYAQDSKWIAVGLFFNLIPVPKKDDNLNIFLNSGDLLGILLKNNVDLVLVNYPHPLFNWTINSKWVGRKKESEMLIIHSPESKGEYNVIVQDDSGFSMD